MVLFLIWSFRNRQWWNPEQAGYTPNASDAGIYHAQRAATIVLMNGLPGQNIAIDVETARRYFNGLTADEVEEKLESWKRL